MGSLHAVGQSQASWLPLSLAMTSSGEEVADDSHGGKGIFFSARMVDYRNVGDMKCGVDSRNPVCFRPTAKGDAHIG